MKLIKSLLLSLSAVLLLGSLSSCAEEGKEFEHDNNLIAQMYMTLRPGGAGLSATIEEYDAQGELVPKNEVTLKRVEGGYGIVRFVIDPELKGEYNPEKCYLNSSLTFDEVIVPGLAGIKNITNRNAEGVAQGIDVVCRSGIGTVRPYKIIGYFEGEYQITPAN